MDTKLRKWLLTGKYLPEFMRDFDNQKNIFRSIDQLYEGNDPGHIKMPNWVSAHCYVIDWFLWFMASRGYTLQKCRAKQEFRPIPEMREVIDKKLG